ncbi:MAG: hypothetical protein ABIH36_00740 [bacterium]
MNKFLLSWMKSSEPEAPVLLTGVSDEKMEQVVSGIAAREDVEVTRLATDKPTISIEELRELFSVIARTTLAAKRLVVMPAAERLSLPAANALLKSLEDSTKTTRFLLTSTNPGRLPTTIRSRCQQVRVAIAAGKTLGVNGKTPRVEEAAGEIEQLALNLGERLRHNGPSPELKLAFMRLRDYYCIKSLRGNEKLAREVLFASLPDNIT